MFIFGDSARYDRPEKFHDAFFRCTGTAAEKIEGVVAIDGKTVRRSRMMQKGTRRLLWRTALCILKRMYFPVRKKDLVKESRYYKDVCFDHGRQ